MPMSQCTMRLEGVGFFRWSIMVVLSLKATFADMKPQTTPEWCFLIR